MAEHDIWVLQAVRCPSPASVPARAGKGAWPCSRTTAHHDICFCAAIELPCTGVHVLGNLGCTGEADAGQSRPPAAS